MQIHSVAKRPSAASGAGAARHGRPSPALCADGIRTSSPAASASASASRAHWPSNPTSSSATSRSPRSTSPFRRRSINLLEDLQAAVRPDLPVHRPRPLRGQAHLRPRRRDVSRQDRRDGRREDLYRRPLHPYTRRSSRAVPIPDPQVEKQRERIILTRRRPEPHQPALRLPLPYALSHRGRAVSKGGAGSRRTCSGACLGVLEGP